EIKVLVVKGTKSDAIRYAAGANAGHGLRYTQPDRRRAVEALLADPEWSTWSDKEIARHCQVCDRTVNRLRKKRSATVSQREEATTERKFKRGGKTHTQRLRKKAAANSSSDTAAPAPATGVPDAQPASGVPQPQEAALPVAGAASQQALGD